MRINNKRKILFSAHTVFLLFVLLVAIFLSWMLSLKVDVTKVIPAELISSTNASQLQYKTAAVIDEVFVRAGQFVKKGQPLLKLSVAAKGSSMEALLSQFAFVNAQMLDLSAKMAQRPIQSQIVLATIKQLQSQLIILQQKIKLNQQNMSQSLSNYFVRLSLSRQSASLQHQISQNIIMLKQAQTKLIQSTAVFHHDYQRLSDVMWQSYHQSHDYIQQLIEYSGLFQSTNVRSAANGLVKKIYIFSPGEIVAAKQVALDISPNNEVLIIDAKLPESDRGRLSSGQTVIVHLKHSSFKAIAAKLAYISEDTVSSDKGKKFYQLRVVTNIDCSQNQKICYQLYSGAPLSISFRLGKTQMIKRIFHPLLKLF